MPRPPRRPDALHAILRYEALVRDGAVRPPSAFDPRIRATLDLAMQETVTKLARRHLDRLARGRGAAGRRNRRGARQPGCSRSSRLDGLSGPPGRRHRLRQRHPFAGQHPEAVHLCAGAGPRLVEAGGCAGRPARRRVRHRQCGRHLSRSDAAAPGARQFAQRARHEFAARGWARGGLRLFPRLGASRFGCSRGQFRPVDGDRLASNQPGTARPCIWCAG